MELHVQQKQIKAASSDEWALALGARWSAGRTLANAFHIMSRLLCAVLSSDWDPYQTCEIWGRLNNEY